MLRKRSRGQGLTELAIILPILLLSVFLIVETGRIFQAYVTVQNAARQGARYAVTGQGGDDRVTNIKEAAKDILAAGLPLADCGGYCCDTNPPPEGYCILVWSPGGYDDAGLPGQRVQVQVTYQVRVITPFLSTIARVVPVTGRVEMVNEPIGPTPLGQSGAPPPPLGIPDTPTPTPKPEIHIDPQPLYPGRKYVAGYGDPAGWSQVTVQIYDWLDETGSPVKTLMGDQTIQITDPFRYNFRVDLGEGFELLPEHTIRAVASNGAYDDAPVLPTTGTGSITVQKSDANEAQPGDWTFEVRHSDGTTYSSLNSGSMLSDIDLGRYTITESGPPGWRLESVTGDGCTQVGDSAVAMLIADGQSITCTFNNTPYSGSITIIKSDDYGADPSQWTFSVDGPDGFHREDLVSGSTLDGLALGSYTIHEEPIEGWHLETVQGCLPLAGSAWVDLTYDGQSNTCTFVNAPDAASIGIEKYTNDQDADDPPGIYILENDPVTWEYHVTNTGNFTLTNVTVTDTMGIVPDCLGQTTLAIGESMTCSASGSAEVGQYENIGGAEGWYLGTAVSDSDPSHYTGEEPPPGTRVNCGDDWDYEDPEGKVWELDPPYSAGSWGYVGELERTNRNHGKCGALTPLYNSYDAGQFFGFKFDNFTPGIYTVTLHLVEPDFSSADSRLFDVAIEDKMVLNDFDLFAAAGGKCIAYSQSFNAIVTDGQLNIDLSGTTFDDEGIISGIEIEFKDVPPTPTPTPTPTETPIPGDTPTPTPVRLPDLTIAGLSVPAGDPIPAWTPVTVTTNVFNDSTGPCSQFFWTDLYVYTDTLDYPQAGDPGVAWQGLGGLDPYMETTLTFDHTFYVSGTHYLYTQADSFQVVAEEDETNNVSQPLTITVRYVDDTPTPTSTPEIICDPESKISGTVWAFIGGQLVVPEDRAIVSLYDQNATLIGDPVITDAEGGYVFECVPEGTGYTVMGLVEIGGVVYVGSESGIEVVTGQETQYVDIILYPV